MRLMDDPAFAARVEKLIAQNLGNHDAVPATVRLMEDVLDRRIPGVFMECGVGAGSHPAAMGMVLDVYEDPRTVYLCDSFDGIPRPGPHDREYVSLLGEGNGELESTGVSRCPIDDVRANMERWGVTTARFRYVQGWFQDTLRAEARRIWRANERLALLRIDANLYESVKCVMDNMVPLLSRGGVLILDDYGGDGGRKAIDEWFNKYAATPKLAAVSPGDKNSAMYCIRDW